MIQIRTRIAIAAFSLSLIGSAEASTTDVSAVHGVHGYPCVSCDAYDYGSMYAAEHSITDIGDCEFDDDSAESHKLAIDDGEDEGVGGGNDEEDEDAAETNEFSEGCRDYVRYRLQRAEAQSSQVVRISY